MLIDEKKIDFESQILVKFWYFWHLPINPILKIQ